MAKKYRTARGRTLDMDSVRLANEETIAIGNMRVNARGDQLGAGGKVVKTRNQIMKSHYKRPPIAVDDLAPKKTEKAKKATSKKEPEVTEQNVVARSKTGARGKLANDVLSKENTGI